MLNDAEHEWLEDFLTACDENSHRLSDWEKGFLADQVKRLEEYDRSMTLSYKQWGVLRRMAKKIGYDVPSIIPGDDE